MQFLKKKKRKVFGHKHIYIWSSVEIKSLSYGFHTIWKDFNNHQTKCEHSICTRKKKKKLLYVYKKIIESKAEYKIFSQKDDWRYCILSGPVLCVKIKTKYIYIKKKVENDVKSWISRPKRIKIKSNMIGQWIKKS